MSPSDLPKVLHLIAPAATGGAESVVRSLSAGAQQWGAEAQVAVIAQDAEPLPFVSDLRRENVPVTEIRCGRRRYLKEVREVTRLVRAASPEILHTHVYHADAVGYMAARRTGVPVVSTVHGFTGGDWKNRLYQRLDLAVLRRLPAVIAVSETVRHRLLDSGCSPDRVRTVSNGYLAASAPLSRSQARQELGLTESGPVVGWVGRLSAEKGPDQLVDAIASLPAPRPVAVLIGEGQERARVASQVIERGLTPGSVKLVGEVAAAARVLTAFDVLVISSRTEGLPIVLLEAMAAEVPVVAFAVGGIPDAVDSSAAWLVSPGDSVALGRAIAQALGQADEARVRAVSAKRILEQRFSLRGWLERVYAVYREVLHR